MATMFTAVPWHLAQGPRDALRKECDLLHAKLQETRLLAAMQRVNARLLIHADDREETEAYRACVVQVQDEEDPQRWVSVGKIHRLSPDHRVVPMKSDAEGLDVEDWSIGLSSIELAYDERTWAQGTQCYSAEFKPTGRIGHTSYLLVLQRQDPQQGKRSHRGLRVNSYGQISQLGSTEDHETAR